MALYRFFSRRFFRLPSPTDLGWSSTDALGLRKFTPYQEGKTWEDWNAYVRSHYPVRYFMAETLPRWTWAKWIRPMQRIWRWVLDHVVPSRRYHYLDLRGVDPLSMYSHGYLDPSDVFWLAGWACLMRWYRETGSRTDLREQGLDPQSHHVRQYCEALELVRYWTITRLEREKQSERLHNAVEAIQTTPENQARYESAKNDWLEYHHASERLEEVMWVRLAVLRPFLWD